VRAWLLVGAATQFVLLTVIADARLPRGRGVRGRRRPLPVLRELFQRSRGDADVLGPVEHPSHALFSVALALVGLALVAFSTTWRVIVRRPGAGAGLGRVTQWVAVVAGLGFVGIAATPWDRVLDAHNAFVRLAFGVLLLYILALLWLHVRNDWPRSLVALNVVYLVVLVAYVLVLFLGPDLTTRHGLELQVAAQKIIVFSSVVNLGVQAYAVARRAG
jgi:hypothetical protein